MIRQIGVWYCDKDKIYIAEVIDTPSIAAHGDTPEEAIGELRIVINMIDNAFED